MLITIQCLPPFEGDNPGDGQLLSIPPAAPLHQDSDLAIYSRHPFREAVGKRPFRQGCAKPRLDVGLASPPSNRIAIETCPELLHRSRVTPHDQHLLGG